MTMAKRSVNARYTISNKKMTLSKNPYFIYKKSVVDIQGKTKLPTVSNPKKPIGIKKEFNKMIVPNVGITQK
ncbi:hypothetical protein [Neobacillus niacini]|uniref:hypothetical protein n=1 Tax=Neobacillus niacini TaxID=86668 RepID=UPI001C3F1925|nr:hypothetical protein [Neobacillus niacini]